MQIKKDHILTLNGYIHISLTHLYEMIKYSKAYTKNWSHRNGHISLHKSECRISKGAIHVQASFKNSIVIIRNVQGQLVSESPTTTSGFKCMKKGPS